jgi:hypothetical protein
MLRNTDEVMERMQTHVGDISYFSILSPPTEQEIEDHGVKE